MVVAIQGSCICTSRGRNDVAMTVKFYGNIFFLVQEKRTVVGVYWWLFSIVWEGDFGDMGVRLKTERPMVFKTPTLSVVLASGPLT